MVKEKQQDHIWTKSFISISLTQLLIFTIFYTLLTTLPLYVIQHMGRSQSDGGLVVTVMLVAAIIVRPFSAKVLDLVGKKKTLVMSVILFAITTFIYIWIDQFIPLLILRFIHGISFAIVTTATGAIVADIIPPSRRGTGMGYFAMAMNIAIVVGPFIGLTLLSFVSFKMLFLILSILMIISVIFSSMVQLKTPETIQEKSDISFKLTWNDLIEVKVLSVSFIGGLVGMAYATILSFVSVFAEEIGLASAASYFFLIFAIVMIAFRPVLGRAFDNHGPRIVLIPSLIVFAAGLMLLSATHTSLMLFVAAGLIGLGYGNMLPGFQAIAIQNTEKHRSGHAISTFLIFYDCGIALGAYIWGIIALNYGFKNMYIISAMLVFITMFMFNHYLTRRKKAAHSKQNAS